MSEQPTLLLADHSVAIQRVVELTFGPEAINVVSVGDGDRAFAVLRESRPDIVLADIALPGRNGYELARHIRQTAAFDRVPVLLMTGAFEPVDEARAREVGSDGVLVKPFEPQAVLLRVKELLARAAAAAPSEAGPEPAGIVVAEESASSAIPVAPLEAARPPNADHLDEYFDQLSQAFAERAAAVSVPEAPSPAHEIESTLSAAEGSSVGVPDPPVLAGAFSALLAAEQSETAPDPFAEWLPPAPAAPSFDPAALPDVVVDRIAGRVLERLSDRSVGDVVARIVTATAERLVREEIERIKSNIK